MNRLDLAGAPMNTLMVATTDAAKPLLGLPRTIGVAVVIALACGGFIIWDCSSRDGTSINGSITSSPASGPTAAFAAWTRTMPQSACPISWSESPGYEEYAETATRRL